jgi:hypothetical protein
MTIPMPANWSHATSSSTNAQASRVDVTGMRRVSTEPNQAGIGVSDRFISPWPARPGPTASTISQRMPEPVRGGVRPWPDSSATGTHTAVAHSAVAAVYWTEDLSRWVRMGPTPPSPRC